MSRALDGYQAYKYNKEKKAKRQGKSTEVTKIYDSDLPENQNQNTSPLEAFKRERGLGTLTDAGRAAYANRAVKTNPFDSMPNRTAGAQALWDLSQQSITQRNNVTDPADRFKALPFSTVNQIGGLPGAVQQKRVEEYKASQAAPGGMGSFDDMAAAITADKQKREKAAKEALDMRPSYMKQQGQAPVPQDQLKAENFADAWNYGSNMEGSRNKAKTYNEYLDDLKTGRADAGRFNAGVEKGRQDTRNGLDLTDAEQMQSALGGGQRAGAQETTAMLTDQEKQNYYYIAGTQGKNDAENYRQHVIQRRGLNEQIAKRNQEAIAREMSYQTPTDRFLFESGTQFLLGAGGALENMSRVPAALTGDTSYRAESTGQHLSQEMANAVDTSTLSGKAYKTWQQLMNTSGNNAVSIAGGVAFGPGVGSALFAAQAAGDAYQQVINEGGTVQQAQFFAAMQAIDEEVTNALLGGIAARGGGLLKDALGNTAVARTLQSAMKGMFVNNPVGLRIANGVLDALANGGSEALQEYTQYFSEKFEKWLATGEAPTFNVDGKEMTWDQIVEAKGSAAWDVFANPEALESALMGFLNAGLMNGIGSVGRTADAFQQGRNLSQDSYQTVLDMVDPNITHYRKEDTYRAGKEAVELARDQQRRVEAGRGNTLMSQYGRGLMAQAAQEYQRQYANNETAGRTYYNPDQVKALMAENERKNRALRRLAFGGETAVDKLERIRSELAGDTAQAAWETPQNDYGMHEVTIPAEMHEQYTQDMLNRGSADRLEWEGDSGEMVSLQREDDGYYTFTNERGEEITLDPDEAGDLLPSGQPITMYDNAGSNAVETAGASATPWGQNGTAAPSTASQAPSTAAAAQTTARTTAAPTVSQVSPNNAPSNGVAISQQGAGASGTDRLAQLADEAGKQTVEQREAQRNAIYEAGKNRDSNFQTVMDGATMLSEEEKTAAFNQGMQDSLNEVRMEGQNNGRTEEGNLVSGEGSGRNVSLRAAEQTSGVQQAAGGTAEAGNGRGVLGETDRGSLGEGSGRVNAGRTGVAPERNRGFRNREIVQNLERAADKEVRNATADMIEVGEVAPARDLLRTAVPGQTLIPVFGGKTYSLRKTEAMVQAYDKNIMMTPFISSGEIMVGGGESSRAFADPVRRQLGFRLNDEEATGIQLTKHELIEFGIMDGKVNVDQAFDAITSVIPQRYIDAIVGEYFASSTKGMSLTADETENAFRHAMKEMICDIGAGIDQISGRIKDEKARRLFEVVHERANKALTSYLNERLNNAFNAEPEMPSRIVGDNQKIDISDGEISVDKIVPGIIEMPDERVENSTSLYRGPAQKELFTLSKDGEISIKEKLNMSGRDFLIKQMKEKGYRDKKNTLAWLDKTADFMDKAETVYTYIGLDDIKNTKLVIDPRSGNIVLRALVKNGEYPVNIDLTKECTRRIALGKFVDWLSRNAGRKGGKTMLEEVPLTASNLVLFNKILKDEGFDTACLGCFVETRRYRIQEWADSFIEKYNKAVEKNNPNAEYFNFADKNVYVSDLSKKDLADLNEALESYKANVKEERNAKKAFAKAEKERLKSIGATKKQIDDVKSELSNEEKINALVRSNKIYQKKLRVSDLITPGGRTVLHRDFPELESLVLGHYGSNTPKSVELFTPYNYDLGSIQAVGKQTLQDYVAPIGGAREQSFSDSVPTHLMDQMEKTADMAVNKLPDHIYTKVPSEVMLFGLTRRKFNMSIMFNIDPDVDSAHAGLRADGSYFVGDRKTSELEAKAGREKTFVQSFPYDMARKIQHMPGYSKNCGMIGVGYSYFHIKKMLADPEFGYLIGYHPSGMNGELASASYIEKATSYEPVQNTLKIKGLRYVTGELNGLPSYASWPQGTKTTDNKMIEKTKFTMKDFDMKGNLKKYGGKETMRRFLAWLEENRLTVDTSKASYDGVEQHGVGSFPLYEDLAKTKDYRKTADNYITWCLENDMLPEFYEFADDDNYFNFIYDYTPYDHNTGKYSPQLPVQMNFPDNFFKLASHSLNQWNNYMMRQDPKEIPTFERMYNEAVQYSSKLGSGEIDMRSAAESDEDSLQTKINSSMTMDQAKQMVQRAFNIGDIKAWFDGEYKNGDEWLAGEGSRAVALVIDNDYSLQQKYINKVQGILDDEFTIEDILDAYSNQSLTGAVKEKKSYDVDLSKSAGYKDNRFYAPKAPDVTAETLNTANMRATAANKEQVNKARLDILIAAHNDANIADKLGITKPELNKKLRTWSRYSANAMSLAERLNKGVALENQWSGLQNCSIISQMNVTDDGINSMVKSITGTSRGNERNYIAKTILAADTHIDWSWLNFEFKAGRAVENSANVRGLFGNDNIIIGGNGYMNTVAHEMGHALSNKWASDLMGTEPGHGTDLADHLYNESYIKDPDAKRFAKHFEAFMDSLTDVNDIRSEYTNRPGEVFARFFAKFVEWTNKTAGNYFFSENEYYKDQFKPSQYTEFVKLLQEKAALDAKQAVAEETSTPDVETAADDPNNMGVIKQGSEKDIQYSSKLFDKDISDKLKASMATFFSGTGTVDFALRNIVNHEFAVEYDAKIAAVYRANNGDNIYVDDVRNVNINKHKGRVEYFHASPVCKNYSGAKNNAEELPLDLETAQATADAINTLQPKVVTVENVARYRNSEAIKIIEDALRKNGYTFDKGVYRASDFGGATIRERMFLRAVKDGTLPKIDTSEYAPMSWYDAVQDLIPKLPKVSMPNFMAERLEPSGIDINNLKQPIFILGGNKGRTLSYAEADKPAPTILANSHDARIVMPDGRILKATPRVMARIQGLPDAFDLKDGKGGMTNAYRVVGNGVPVQLTQGIVGPLLEENLIKQKSEATGIQYSSKLQGEIDEQYDEALRNNDMDAAAKLVKEAAEKAGYTEDIYHGTRSFGFTKFNLDKTADGISIFATSDRDLAETYSGETRREKISERAGENEDAVIDRIDGMKDEDLLPLIKEHLDSKYEQVSKKRLQEMRKERVDDIRQYADKIMDYLDNNEDELDEKTKIAASRLASSMYKVSRSKTVDDVTEYQRYYFDDAFELKVIDPNAYYDMFDDIRGASAVDRAINELRKLVESDVMFTNGERRPGSTLDVLPPNEARNLLIGELSKGVYHLYGKNENMLEFNADGDDWNSIRTFGIENKAWHVKNSKWDGYILSYNDAQTLAARITRELNGEDDYLDVKDKRNELEEITSYVFSSHKTKKKIMELESMLPARAMTRDIAKYAKTVGYDGVIIRNLKDSGGGTPYNHPGDVYIYFNSSAVKSADTVTYNDDGEVIPLNERFWDSKEDIRYSSKLEPSNYAPTFYSKLQREIQNFKGEKIGAASVESYLKGKGVKDEEIKWSGIRTFLEGKKSVNKQELMDYLKANELEIVETTLTPGGNSPIWSRDDGQEINTEHYYDTTQGTEFSNFEEFKKEAIKRAAEDGFTESDLVFHFDEDHHYMEAATKDDYTILEAFPPDPYDLRDSDFRNKTATQWDSYKLDGGKNYREILFGMPGSDYINRAMRTHWDRPGVVAHARVQDFDSPGGKKTLFIEEIQSDWHNEGQKYGYKTEEGSSVSEKDADVRFEEGLYTLYVNGEYTGSFFSPEYMERAGIAKKDVKKALIEDYQKTLHLNNLDDTAPDAPFRTTYTDFVLKDLLRMAAEGNYDYLAWTTGKMQEERWSDQYAEGYRIEYDQQIPKFLKKYGKQWGAGLQDVKIYGGWAANGDAPFVPAIVINDAMKKSVLTEGQPMYSSKNTGEIDEKALDPRRVFISYNPDLQNAVREISDVLTAYQELAPTQAEIKRTTRQIAKKFGSHINVELAARKMETLYNFLAGGGKPDGREVLEISMDIANDILDEATHNDPEIEKRWKKFKQEMRKRWIYVPKDRVRDLNPDGIKALRKQWKGKMVFTTDEKYRERYGQIHYQELQQMFPEYFTKNADNMNDIEAIEEIMFAFDAQAPIYEQIYTGATRDEAALEIAYDIMQGYFGNDRAKDRFKKIYRDYVKPIKDRAIDEYRDKLRSIELKDAAAVEQRSVFDQIKGMKGSYVVNEKALKDVDYQGRQAMMERLREKAEQDKKRYEEQIEKVKAGYVERSQKDRLMRLAKELRAMKGGPEFEAKKKELIGDLDLIAKGISYNYERKLMDMKEEYERLAEEDENFEPDRATIKKIERLQKKQINQMTAYEITALTEAILKMKQDQWTHNRMIRETDAALVADEGRKIVNETNALKGTKGMNRLADAIDGYSLAHLNSKRAFRKMSGYNDKSGLMKLWNELNEGQHKTMDFRRRAVSPFDAFMSEEENKDFITGMFDPTVEITSSKIEIEDENGNIVRTHEPQTVKITPAMKISIYLHSLNQDNREHARYGGFRIPNMDKYERGDYSNAYGQGSKIVRLTKADMQNIASTMTPQELKFADLAYEYFNKTSKEAINEASMLLNGYELASVDNYMPIKTDPNFTKKDISGLIQDGTIEGQGWTKDRNFMAKNPILLEDITQVLQRSIDGAALYYGLAIPVRNFNKVYEFQRSGYTDSVKEAIMQTFGKRGNEYIEKLLRDLQGGNMDTKDAAGKWVDRFTSGLRGNYAQAILTLNPSVAIKQAASYPTAAARLGFEPLKKALAKLPTSTSEDMDLINKYTPLLWYRAQGQSSDALAEVSKRKEAWEYKGGVEKTRQMFNWIQNIDVKTVKTLWYASEYYVQDNMPSFKEGTEAYYREVAKVFNEVVEDTQPNYTTMQRASISRVDNEIMKAVFMFKTQPLQNLGILYDSIMEYQAKQNTFKEAVKNGTQEEQDAAAADMAFARQGMMRSVASVTVSTLVFSAMTQLAKLLLHRVDPLRDEETGELTKASILKNFFGNAAESVAGMLAGAGEIYSLIMAMTTGSYLDNLSVSGIDALNETMTKMLKTYQNIGKIWEDEEATPRQKTAASIVASRDLAIQIMDLTGIPANNAKKIAEALINHYHDVINPIFTGRPIDTNLESGARITDKQYANRALKYYQRNDIAKGDKAAAKIEKASAMQSVLGAQGKKDEKGNSISNSKKYDAIHRILRTPGSDEAHGKMFAAAYPSDELARYMYGGGSAFDFMQGQMLAEEIAALSEDEREKKLYSFVEETGYTLDQKKAWLVSDKDRIESKTLTAWRDANGTDWDYIKHMSNLEKFNGSKNKKEKVVAYIKRQTTDTKKRKALFLMAGYQLDSKEDGKTVKDGNFKKAMGN